MKKYLLFYKIDWVYENNRLDLSINELFFLPFTYVFYFVSYQLPSLIICGKSTKTTKANPVRQSLRNNNSSKKELWLCNDFSMLKIGAGQEGLIYHYLATMRHCFVWFASTINDCKNEPESESQSASLSLSVVQLLRQDNAT
jgi:hypothetical protein